MPFLTHDNIDSVPKSGARKLSVKGCVVDIFGFVDHEGQGPVATTHLCFYDAKAAIDMMSANGHG